MTLADFFSATNPTTDPLWNDLTKVIRDKGAAHPRHLQRELGPSDVAHPCMRRMAFGTMEVPRCNPEWDPLPSIMGIAGHNWNQEAFDWDNERLGRRRWLTETRVEVTPGLSGSSDLFDTDTGTVIDWKFLGYRSFDKHVSNIGPTYRCQVQLYGRGFQRLGYTVNRVAVALLPRTGTLTKMHMDVQEYDDSIVDMVLRKREAVLCMIIDWDVENHPERYQWFPTQPESCLFCPFFAPNTKSPMQCNGKATS